MKFSLHILLEEGNVVKYCFGIATILLGVNSSARPGPLFSLDFVLLHYLLMAVTRPKKKKGRTVVRRKQRKQYHKVNSVDPRIQRVWNPKKSPHENYKVFSQFSCFRSVLSSMTSFHLHHDNVDSERWVYSHSLLELGYSRYVWNREETNQCLGRRWRRERGNR